MISATDARRFDDDGYLVVRNLLDAQRATAPLRDAYTALIDALATIYEVTLDRPPAPRASPSDGERLATLLGLSGGDVLHHLAPVLSVFSPRFRWRPDLPPAQLAECFALLPAPNVTATTHARAAAITRRWNEAVPNARAWFRLAEHPTRSRPARLARRLAVATRRWISSVVRG